MNIAQKTIFYLLISCIPFVCNAMNKENRNKTKGVYKRLLITSFNNGIQKKISPACKERLLSSELKRVGDDRSNNAIEIQQQVDELCNDGAHPDALIALGLDANTLFVTPLFCAARNLNSVALSAMLTYPCNVNCQNSNGKTPLHGAAEAQQDSQQSPQQFEQNKYVAIERLLSKGSSPDIFDNEGNLPIDFITHSSIATMLDATSYLVNQNTVYMESLCTILTTPEQPYPTSLAQIILAFIPKNYVENQRALAIQRTLSSALFAPVSNSVSSNSSSCRLRPLKDISNNSPVKKQKVNEMFTSIASQKQEE